MNTGIQNALAERWPVGRFLLRYADRVFATFTPER